MTGCVYRLNFRSGDSDPLIYVEVAIPDTGMCCFPQYFIGRVKQYGSVKPMGQFRCGSDVVVVTVCADHRDHVAAGDSGNDRFGVVCGVNHDHVGVVSDQPHVVVDIPASAVKFESARRDNPFDTNGVAFGVQFGDVGHGTTTDRSTSPACITRKGFSQPRTVSDTMDSFARRCGAVGVSRR